MVAIRKAEERGPETFLFNPGAATRVDAEDVLMAIGESRQIEALRGLVGPGVDAAVRT